MKEVVSGASQREWRGLFPLSLGAVMTHGAARGRQSYLRSS